MADITTNVIRNMPEIERRTGIVERAHKKETAHRGIDTVMKEIRKEYYWPKMR